MSFCRTNPSPRQSKSRVERLRPLECCSPEFLRPAWATSSPLAGVFNSFATIYVADSQDFIDPFLTPRSSMPSQQLYVPCRLVTFFLLFNEFSISGDCTIHRPSLLRLPIPDGSRSSVLSWPVSSFDRKRFCLRGASRLRSVNLRPTQFFCGFDALLSFLGPAFLPHFEARLRLFFALRATPFLSQNLFFLGEALISRNCFQRVSSPLSHMQIPLVPLGLRLLMTVFIVHFTPVRQTGFPSIESPLGRRGTL